MKWEHAECFLKKTHFGINHINGMNDIRWNDIENIQIKY